MSDFTYDLVPLNTSADLLPGTATISTTSIYIQPTTNKGQDLASYLNAWSDDAASKVPFDLTINFVTENKVVVAEINKVINQVEDEGGLKPSVRMYFTEDPAVVFADISDISSGEVSLEIGLKVIAKDKPCGGLEVFTVTEEDNPTCTNSITFRNTVTGREFSFNNIQVGTYEFQFEGPSERYEIIWADPQGCNEDEIGILNRVDRNNKRLRLEDYGAQDESKWNFVDLMVEAKYGEYEWAGGDTDPVFFITQSDGNLCPDGFYCENDVCIEEGTIGRVELDDLLIIHNGEQDELYHVEARNFVTRATGSVSVPVIRDGVAYHTPAFSCQNILPTDSIPIYRPSDSRNYQLTGEQFVNEFCYPAQPFPILYGARLYNKAGNVGVNGETFVLEIDAPPGQNVDYRVITRVLTNTPDSWSQKACLYLPPSDRVFTSMETGSRSSYPFLGDLWQAANVRNVWTQPSGCTFTTEVSVTTQFRDARGYWSTYAYNNDSGIAGTVTNRELYEPDEPFIGDLSGFDDAYNIFTPPLTSLAGSYPSWTATFETPENFPLIFEGIDYTSIDRNSGSWECVNGGLWQNGQVDFRSLTVNGDWDTGPTLVNGLQNEPWYNGCMELIGGNPTNCLMRKNRGEDPLGMAMNRFIDITPGTQPSEIKDFGSFVNIGPTQKYEFTMSPSTVLGGSLADSALAQGGAFMICTVVAYNRTGFAEAVQSNYLLVA